MTTLDELLARLEASIALLSEGTAPLEDLVQAHESAARLVEQADTELARLWDWARDAAPPAEPEP